MRMKIALLSICKHANENDNLTFIKALVLVLLAYNTNIG